MDNIKLIKLNNFINRAYMCRSFVELLKHVILNLHELVMYESGMFFCGISEDCSFFKPYIIKDSGVKIEDYYKKQEFTSREEYLKVNEILQIGNEALVYKAMDYKKGIVEVIDEPRNSFLSLQQDYHIVCIRIINESQFLGEIYLHRSMDKPDFSEDDLFVLKLMQPHISTVFGLIHTAGTVRFLETVDKTNSQKGICVFDQELNLTGGNIAGLDMIKMSTVFNSSVLYHLKEYCNDILKNEEQPEKNSSRISNYSLKIPKGTLNIEVHYSNNLRTRKNISFIIILEFANPDRIVEEYKFKFTKREADVIDGLIQGRTNTQIANQLCISENTVKSHIRKLYQKTGVNNRTELAFLLMQA